MSNTKQENKYSIHYTKDDLVGYYVRSWVMEWVKKYHPEAFTEAEKFVRDFLKNEK